MITKVVGTKKSDPVCSRRDDSHMLKEVDVIPQLYLRLLWFFGRTDILFRQIRTFPQLFRFCSDLGNPEIRRRLS